MDAARLGKANGAGKGEMRIGRRRYGIWREGVSAALTAAVVAIAVAAGARAADPRQTPETVASGTVREIVDGDTVVLDGGTELRLVNIQAPKLPLGRKNFQAWPLADEAKRTLAALTLGKTLALEYDGRRIDRHGRLLAHLRDADGRWIQGEMVSGGMARVYSFADNRARTRDLLDLERVARAARRGIWAHPYYAVRGLDDLEKYVGTFQVIEGRVASAATVKGRAYLNFGADWRTDFTVTISARDGRRFRGSDIDPGALAGKLVRVRGWLKSYNGPMIEVTHPEQIETLSQ